MEQYRNKNFNASTRKILENYSPEGFEDLWKREVEELAKCRSYADVESNEVVDPIIKTDFFNDLKGMYMTLVDARGGEFLLTDIYTCSQCGKKGGDSEFYFTQGNQGTCWECHYGPERYKEIKKHRGW